MGTWTDKDKNGRDVNGQGTDVERARQGRVTRTVANGRGRLWLTTSDICCVKKKHARQTEVHPYIQ